MLNQTTRIKSENTLPFRAAGLLFLMLCLMISCPVKRELKSIFMADVPVSGSSSISQFPKQITNSSGETDFEIACAKTGQSLLDEAKINPLFQKFSFQNPFFFLAFTLAGLYLLLTGSGTTPRLLNAFSGNALAPKTPLFLRHRQLLI